MRINLTAEQKQKEEDLAYCPATLGWAHDLAPGRDGDASQTGFTCRTCKEWYACPPPAPSVSQASVVPAAEEVTADDAVEAVQRSADAADAADAGQAAADAGVTSEDLVRALADALQAGTEGGESKLEELRLPRCLAKLSLAEQVLPPLPFPLPALPCPRCVVVPSLLQ